MPRVSKTAKERRDEDQPAAMEAAFVAGTLPEEDRRAEEVIAEIAHASKSELKKIEKAEKAREGDKEGAGRSTVFEAIARRRAELETPQEAPANVDAPAVDETAGSIESIKAIVARVPGECEVEQLKDAELANFARKLLSLPIGSSLEIRERDLRVKVGAVGNPQYLHGTGAGYRGSAVLELLEQL